MHWLHKPNSAMMFVCYQSPLNYLAFQWFDSDEDFFLETRD
jgi:hypothetical protein